MRRTGRYFVAMTGALLACSVVTYPQSNVSWISCGLSGVAIHDIAITDQGTVFAQSDSGLFRSTDSGDTWVRLLESVGRSVVTRSSIVLAGVDSLLLKSTDEGDTWATILTVMNDRSWGSRWVTSVSIDPLAGLILAATGSVECYDGRCPCGYEGELLRSTDGGVTWDTTDIRRYVQGVVILGNGHAYAATTGDRDTIWVPELGCFRDTVWGTTDGGETWSWSWGGGEGACALGAAGWEDVFFCYRNALLSSRDSGASWQTVDALPYGTNDLAFNAQGDLFVTAWSGGVNMNNLETNDGLTDLYTTCLAVSPSGHVFVGTTFGGVFRTTETTVEVADHVTRVPEIPTLEQNYPNPFNPSTTIRYALPLRSHVTLTVFNTLGQQAATLVQGEQEAGYHEAVFDASGLAGGVYLYRLQAGDLVQAKKLVLIR